MEPSQNSCHQTNWSKSTLLLSTKQGVFDLRDPDQRLLALVFLLNHGTDGVNFLNCPNTPITDVNMYARSRLISNLLSFEVIGSLTSITKNYDYRAGQLRIALILHRSPLVQKVIFQSSPKLWRAFIDDCISTIGDANVRLQTGFSLHEYLELVTFSLRFWRRNHFEYALSNGICALITDLYESRASRLDRKICASILYFTIRKCLKQFDDLTVRFDALFKSQSFRNVLGNASAILAVRQFRKWVLAPRRDLTLCGWPWCSQATLAFNRALDGMTTCKKCKGCRLIRYCSRKHQKKHWILIHSQQCKRYK